MSPTKSDIEITKKLDEILLQVTKTNGRVTFNEKCIAELKADGNRLWAVYNRHITDNARREGHQEEWERNMNTFKREIHEEFKKRGLMGAVGSGGASILVVIALKAIGFF